MKKHILMVAVALSLTLAGCGSSADDQTVTVTSSANVRDAATAEGSSVLETLSAGTVLTGRWVENETNPSEQWFEYERDGEKAYVWGRNLSGQPDDELAFADPPRNEMKEQNFLLAICNVDSGDVEECSRQGALKALGANVQPVVYGFFDKDRSGVFVAMNKLRPGITAIPNPEYLSGPEDDTWPEGSFDQVILVDTDKSVPTSYDIDAKGLITVRAQVDTNCTAVFEYVMKDNELFQGETENIGDCGETRVQSNILSNRIRRQDGFLIEGFGEKKFNQKKYINR